ncbi:MAG: hypothetical protein QW701_01805 [Candidatus Nezhaarchaeales archaeon]
MSTFSRKRSSEETLISSPKPEEWKPENPLLLELEFALTRLALMKLTKLQKILLLRLYSEDCNDYTLSSLVRKLSTELEVPESTLKWSLRGLRDMGLITSGGKDAKGIPVSLTYAGLIVAKNIAEGISPCRT